MKNCKLFTLIFSFFCIGISGCNKENTYIYDEISCAQKPWTCIIDCPVGETRESLDAMQEKCVLEFLRDKHICAKKVGIIYTSDGSDATVCGVKTGRKFIVTAPERSSVALKALGFH